MAIYFWLPPRRAVNVIPEEYRTEGYRLKKRAKPTGNFVPVHINNIYNLLEILSSFFYQKKHEWIAICFIEEIFICKLIWFNKGLDRTSAYIGLTSDIIAERAKSIGAKYVIIAHNHPISSFNMPDYGSRRMNILASYAQKEAQFDFSDPDKASGSFYSTSLSQEGIGSAEVVFVAGDYKIYGDKTLIENYNTNKPKNEPKACFIATAVFGQNGWETLVLRDLRDRYLTKFTMGRFLCNLYYYASPPMAKIIGGNPFLRSLARKILYPLVILTKCFGRIGKK